MIFAPAHLAATVAALMATDVAPSAEQLAAVRNEIQNDPEERGYAGKPAVEVLTLLATPYSVPNPATRPNVPRVEWAPDQLKNALFALPSVVEGVSLYRFVCNTGKGDGPLAGKAADFIDALSGLKAIRMDHPLIAEGFGLFRSNGLIPDEAWDYLTTEPDPAWPETVLAPSPLERIGMPAGTVLTARDLAEALG